MQLLWKTAWSSLKKLKIKLSFDPVVPILGMHLQNPETPIQKNLCSPMFTEALFTIAKIWKHLSVHQQMSDTTLQWNTAQQKEGRMPAFCDSMDGTGEHYAK